MQVHAKAWTVAATRRGRRPYMTPPAPMPSNTMARIRPNVNTLPPRSGPSIRYQTSSIRHSVKPATAAAQRVNHGGASGTEDASPWLCSSGGAGAGASGDDRARFRAATATSALKRQAIQSVMRAPKTSNRANVESMQPVTAPSVLIP